MVGGLVIPTNSPHLRKSGSRTVVSDLDENGAENGVDEGLLHSVELNELRGVIPMTMSASAIMPSPILLWRFKVLLFLSWGFICCKIGWDSVMRMSADKRDLFLYEAFLYYNPLLLVTLMVWLWGINLWFFSQAGVNYAKIFDLDQNHLSHREIWKCAIWMTIVVPTSMTAYLYLYSHGEVSYAASQPVILWDATMSVVMSAVYVVAISLQRRLASSLLEHDFLDRPSIPIGRGAPINVLQLLNIASLKPSSIKMNEVLLYGAVVMILIFPFDIFYLSSRYYFLRTLWRIMLPLQAISFSDFFLADILTSMAKVFSDLERSVCRMVHRQVATIAWLEADSVCGSHSIAIPVALVLPYLFRLNQCLRQYKDTGEKTTLLNALKYSTAVPVIFLSALKYHVFPDNWTNLYRPLWLLSSVVNSLYSFYWDVTRDWDLSSFTRIFKFSKPHPLSNSLHGRRWVYVWVIGSNLILRCTWTYKLSAHLRHNYLTVFTIAALEIFRRFQWIFFRVETELNKMNTKSHIQLPTSDMSSEEEKFLHSNSDHSV